MKLFIEAFAALKEPLVLNGEEVPTVPVLELPREDTEYIRKMLGFGGGINANIDYATQEEEESRELSAAYNRPWALR